MKRHHKITLSAAGAAILIGAAVQAYIDLDRWQVEKQVMQRRAVAQSEFEAQVRECDAAGGRWWRGDCLEERTP